MEQVNSKSIAALTLGILAIVIPYIGFILGIIGVILSSKALSEISAHHQNGYGLAVAGRMCSIVGIVLQLILLFLVFLGWSAMFM
ncbi:DUF4190 domain-containing protein [Metabacillus halosaccharovorans]|uniref:DUF4190 domain-containing protein n=1 Tax=Metabacillus halosaccharovorans TaxID=930124 RepID=UPI001C1F7FD6|nr:DUF4190 domain-containing protein [Metabacillus halosaccharovorans]MBU7595260.1 DUF4190 domain-containing protein [Metabacillus halosaccharovorans]